MGCCLVVGGGVSFIDKLLTKFRQRMRIQAARLAGFEPTILASFVTAPQSSLFSCLNGTGFVQKTTKDAIHLRKVVV